MATDPLAAVSITGLWASFEKDILPANAPPVQRQEMRRAFYAGSFGVLTAMLHVVGSNEVGMEEGVLILDRLYNECKAFAARVGEGGA